MLLAEVASENLSYGPLLFKTMLATVVIIGLAFVALRYLLPRLNSMRRNKNSQIQILDYQALDARKAVFILKIEDKKVAVGVTDQSVTKICDL